MYARRYSTKKRKKTAKKNQKVIWSDGYPLFILSTAGPQSACAARNRVTIAAKMRVITTAFIWIYVIMEASRLFELLVYL
jgi:hypothetical protein